MKLRPYTVYKDSGLPWLGRVPEHWDLLRAKYLMREINTRSKDESVILLSVSQYAGVTKRSSREGTEDPDTRSSSLVGYKVAKPGNLVSNIMLAWNGSLGIAPMEGVVSPAYCVYRICIGEPWFFHYLLRSPVYKAEIKRRSRGVVDSRLRLYTDDFFRIPLLLPNLKEQQAIVRFVQDLDGKVRRFIRNRRRLIEVLNEQKQAIINRAVTRGLDPDVPLKPSGSDWIGDIPEHWEVSPLRRLTVEHCDGPFGSGLKSSHYVKSGTRVVRLQNIGLAEFKDTDMAYISNEYAASLSRHSVEAGDVLIAGLGDKRILPGRACVAPDLLSPAIVKADCFRFRVDTGQVSPFFLALQLSATAHIAAGTLGTGATRMRINLERMSGRPVVLPPLVEQHRIVDALISATTEQNKALSATQSEIDLIREYRTRLISDVVTGKVDVRHLAPPPGSEDLEEALESFETLEEDIADAVIDDEESFNDADLYP